MKKRVKGLQEKKGKKVTVTFQAMAISNHQHFCFAGDP